MGVQNFTSKRVSDITKVKPGADNYTVEIPFIPNFIEVTFYDVANVDDDATLSWELTNNADGTASLQIDYDVREERDIRHVVADLYINPEQTISH